VSEERKDWSGWAIVELLGHKRLAGFLSNQEIGGGVLLRVDVPATVPTEPEITYAQRWQYPAPQPTAEYSRFIGLGSIYGITPCTEDVARRAAREIEKHNDPLPVQLPALPAKSTVVGDQVDVSGIIDHLHDEEDEDEYEEARG
jgi:hypothetical protein